MGHFAAMAPWSVGKKRLANVEQAGNKSDRVYLERIDKLIREGEPLGEEAKVLGAITELKKGIKL